ncbi:hypothetical protein NDU88_004420 [Pleurodeles waltl]|uniref:Uncharacterized protein n=1 Tax=Pleurodeles waltl TaxID=8319 RepID=A0AAV7TTH7_PLEWA|nr:hypothetical protein NDU88_004420 [Pleurodeles waltl]
MHDRCVRPPIIYISTVTVSVQVFQVSKKPTGTLARNSEAKQAQKGAQNAVRNASGPERAKERPLVDPT